MGEEELEVLFPLGFLGVGDDAGAGEGGAGEENFDVGIAGDGLGFGLEEERGTRLLARPELFFAIGAAGGGEGEAAGAEAAAEALGEHVHVGEVAGLVDAEVQVAVQEDELLRGGVHCIRRAS